MHNRRRKDSGSIHECWNINLLGTKESKGFYFQYREQQDEDPPNKGWFPEYYLRPRLHCFWSVIDLHLEWKQLALQLLGEWFS